MVKRREFLVGVFTVALAGQIATAATAADNSASGIYAEIPGVKLWFTDSGGMGTPIVLLHANTGTSAVWTDQVTSFSQAGYRVIAFDRRGWGKSIANPATGPQPGSIAGDLDALADYLKLDKFHLLGVAGGGFAALDYAAWHPEKLRSLVIGASTGSIRDREIADFSSRIEIQELRKLPAVYREVGASYRGANPDGTKRWIEIDEHSRQKDAPSQPLRTPNTFAKIETIPTATLIVAADADLLAPPALMRIWAGHVKNHEWANVPDSGHAIAWEHPDVFNEKVLEFVKRH
ncbi:alpha/beta fold hydrolase [Bradyrhizobium erythrophlei]|jgi:pimeloyl-ACP methyl ester carboxylesterase|uniref:Pimeloyl-ACP methyl ester carboxylesterase n=1 Tax=Bradyrhizobium erythrophlei TaxID=1437360 RepID=A0A1M7T1E1_9BRAD|nr:alpha/beta hydrolase [Bradyrhizobium erythrophlei]SHN64590.1 Pimeloyl-ACP methyl ester carboxylesterase [Bradyrhizobium erythrophlei]